MANSRKPLSASEIDDAVGAIRLTVSQALAVIRPDRTLAIAYSGGLDSSVLLDAFVQAAGPERCLAVHIHHGLSDHADHWQRHCQAQSAQRDVRFVTAKVDLSIYRGMGVEAAARLARYAALRDLADQHGAHVLVLGQHADDQAETVLLQMLRGAGLAGLSAMPARRDVDDGIDRADTKTDGAALFDAKAPRKKAPNTIAVDVKAANVEAAIGDATVDANILPLIRPFLSVRRLALEAYAHAQGMAWIEDESNQDVRFARNALRRDVLPVIEQHFPAYRQTLSRVARHAASAQTLFDDLAQIDFDRCVQSSEVAGLAAPLSSARSACLSRAALQMLSVDRLGNLLRFWMRTLNLRAASTSRVEEMVVQLHGLRRRDASVRLRHREQPPFGRLSIRHDGLVLHGYRDHVFWSAVAAASPIDTGEDKNDDTDDDKHARGPHPSSSLSTGAGSPALSDGIAATESNADILYAGESCWRLPVWRGSLLVSPLRAAAQDDAAGEAVENAMPRMRLIVPRNVFVTGQLSARQRRGGERLSLGAGRPSRSLKHLFQEAGVPVWQRDVPLFYLDEMLIFVPYLGGSLQALRHGERVDGRAAFDAPRVDEHVVLEWLPG